MKPRLPGRATVALAVGSLLASAVAAAEPAVSPFSVAYFPQVSQWEWSGRVGLLQSRHETHSLLLSHEGTTVTGLVTPGFRWGWREDLAIEWSQPVAHRFKIDPHNPNVGPEGLRAPTLSAVHRLGKDSPLSWRLAGMVQINPWNNSGLNQWGATVTAVAPGAFLGPASVALAGSRYPDTGMNAVSLSGTWETAMGPWLLQGSLGTTRFSAYSTSVAHMRASQGWSAGLEMSRPLRPGLWAGLSLGLAHHSQQLSTVPTPQLPIALSVSNRTVVQTLNVTLRALY